MGTKDKRVDGYIRRAMALNDAGVKVARPRKRPKPELKVPAALAAPSPRNW